VALLETLVDDFPGSSFDPVQWPTVPAAATVSGGVASITPTTSGLIFIESAAYDATGSYLIVKVVTPPATGTPTTEAYVWLDANNYVKIVQQGTSLTVTWFEAGAGLNVVSVVTTYDPVAHAYWRIRYAAGTFYASASPNGFVWTTEKSQAVTWAVTAVTARLGINRNSATLPTATFDKVNLPEVGFVPTGLAVAVALDNPTASFSASAGSVAADDLPIALALDAPTTTFVPDWTDTATPDGPNDPVTLDDPSTTAANSVTPDDLAVALALDGPALIVTDTEADPDGFNDTITVDDPTVVFGQLATVGDGPSLPVSPDSPAVAFATSATPTGINDAIALDAPAGSVDISATPDGFNDAIGLDPPTFAVSINPDGLAVAVTPGDTAVLWNDTATPGGIALAVALDAPGGTWTATAAPDGLFIHQHTQVPDSVTYPDPVLTPSPIYTRLVPRTPYQDPAAVTAAHFLGIGPWFVEAIWGSINHGIRPRARGVSVPLLPLPASVSKSFTLRLNAGDEARTDFELPRDQAFLVERMATDLWWRRRDPHRSVLEPIGRFNAQTVDISMSELGKVKISCTWIDHRSLLEDRLILNYLDVVHQETQWAAATLCTDILQFVIPSNSQLDLTEIFDTPAAIGTTRWAFEALPGATVADVMDNLSAASSVKFEWYVEMPTTDTDRPKLRLIPGTRGSDKGVILHEIGVGESPIASWAIQAAGEKYANAVMYSDSSAGAAVEIMPVDVKKYGEHDAHVTDSSLKGGVLAAIKDAAARKVAELSSQQITWTLKLRAGYWEGRDHIDVGDWVTVRIALGGETITGKSRVTEISVDIDELGVEDVSLTLGPPRPAKDPRSRYASQARFVRALKASTSKGTPPPEIHTM
jgi:hypothetical protein